MILNQAEYLKQIFNISRDSTLVYSFLWNISCMLVNTTVCHRWGPPCHVPNELIVLLAQEWIHPICGT